MEHWPADGTLQEVRVLSETVLVLTVQTAAQREAVELALDLAPGLLRSPGLLRPRPFSSRPDSLPPRLSRPRPVSPPGPFRSPARFAPRPVSLHRPV